MKRRLRASVSVFAVFLTGPALAAPFDGSQALICATVEMQACAPGNSCEAQSADDIDAPRFLNVSVADKKITGKRISGAPVDATIEVVRHSHDMMFLQGSQEAFAWTMTIGEVDGKMVLTLADNEDGIVVFGACTTH
jgi:hypothetical protein